jgi:outer membrane immunogenic protein
MTSKLIRSGIAALALLAAPLAARAADLGPMPFKGPAYVAPVFSWTGFYVGLNAGYGFGKSDWDFPAGTSVSPDGFLGGVTLGYNLQTGRWVWGLESDLDYTAIKKSDACGAGTCELKTDWFGTARGRIGYAGWNNFMPYITGGAAFADLKASNSATGSESKWKVGWTFGGGLEYALYSRWSIKAEYLYADLGKLSCDAACGASPDDVTYKTQIVRAGVNYRF